MTLWRCLMTSAHKVYLIFFALFAFMHFCSALNFYQGDLSVSSISGKILVNDTSEAQVSLTYSVLNSGKSALTASLTFTGLPDKVSYNIPGANGREINYNFPVGNTEIIASFSEKFDSLSQLTIWPQYTINGKIPTLKIPEQTYMVELGSEDLSLVSSDPVLEQIGLNLYKIISSKNYPTTQRLTIGNKNIQASAKRTISAFSKIGDIINIETTVYNTGESTLDGLSLEDSVFSLYYEPMSSGFTHYLPDEIGEELYIYKQTIPVLKPGENYTLNYSVKAIRMGGLAFTGARILYKGNFLTSTDENQPRIIPLHIAEKIDPLKDDKNALEVRPEQTMPLIINASQIPPFADVPIFREEEKRAFSEENKNLDRKDTLWRIFVLIIVGVIFGLLYYVWRYFIFDSIKGFAKGEESR